MSSVKIVNPGPVFLTQAAYNALVQAGAVEEGREYKITDAPNGVSINGTDAQVSNGKWNITDAALEDVKYTAQTLTINQKTQARTNIGAASYTYSSTAPTTLDENTIHFVV